MNDKEKLDKYMRQSEERREYLEKEFKEFFDKDRSSFFRNLAYLAAAVEQNQQAIEFLIKKLL